MTTKTMAKATSGVGMLINDARMGELELTIERNINGFMEVGAALAEVREGKGYRLRGFRTFEDYCREKWGFDDREGRRLIQEAQAAKVIDAITGQKPASRNAVRSFMPIADKPEKVKQVVEQLGKKGLSVATATGAAVQKVVDRVVGKKPEVRSQKSESSSHAARAEGEALDLWFVWKTLESMVMLVGKTLPSSLKADAERAVGMLSGEYKKSKAAQVVAGAAKCPKCKQGVTEGAVFCDHCGGVL